MPSWFQDARGDPGNYTINSWHNNCRKNSSGSPIWENWVTCPSDPAHPEAPRFATRIVAHYENDPSDRPSDRITGFSLQCGTLLPGEPTPGLILSDRDTNAKWAKPGSSPVTEDDQQFVRTLGDWPQGANAEPLALDTIYWYETAPLGDDANVPCKTGVQGKNLNTPWRLVGSEGGAEFCADKAIDGNPQIATLGHPAYFAPTTARLLPPRSYITGIRICRSTETATNRIKGIRIDGAEVLPDGRVIPLGGSHSYTVYHPSAENANCAHNDLDLPHDEAELINKSSRCGQDGLDRQKIATGINLLYEETDTYPGSDAVISATPLIGIQLICSSVSAWTPVAAGMPEPETKEPPIPVADVLPPPPTDKKDDDPEATTNKPGEPRAKPKNPDKPKGDGDGDAPPPTGQSGLNTVDVSCPSLEDIRQNLLSQNMGQHGWSGLSENWDQGPYFRAAWIDASRTQFRCGYRVVGTVNNWSDGYDYHRIVHDFSFQIERPGTCDPLTNFAEEGGGYICDGGHSVLDGAAASQGRQPETCTARCVPPPRNEVQ